MNVTVNKLNIFYICRYFSYDKNTFKSILIFILVLNVFKSIESIVKL